MAVAGEVTRLSPTPIQRSIMNYRSIDDYRWIKTIIMMAIAVGSTLIACSYFIH